MPNRKKLAVLVSLNCVIVLALVIARPARADQSSAHTPSNVQIEIPPDVPVRIVNFAFDPSPAGMSAFHYDVRNTSGQALVAVEVRWEAQFGDGPGAVVVNRDDRWFTNQLPAGASAHFQVTNVANTRPWTASDSRNPQPTVAQPAASAAPMTRLVATVSYLELEDGSRTGADAAQVGKEIDQARRAQLAATTKLLNAFGTGGNEALAHAIQQGSATTGGDAAAQELNARMLGLLQDQGLDAVVLELQRISALGLPQPRD
jgi:hypothetical protein